jgi:deoxyribodipyrimidine photo-lyase
MAISTVEASRIRELNDGADPERASYVLYWMQQSQRAEHNPALEYAVQLANQHQRPLLVAFGLTSNYPEANARHYQFMLEGLADVSRSLHRRRIKFVVQQGHPPDVASQLAQNAVCVVCDRGYLRHQKAWRQALAVGTDRRVIQVEGDVVVPVNEVTDKREYAARTIRPKILRHLDQYLVALNTTAVQQDAAGLSVEGIDLSDVDALVASLNIDRSVSPNPDFHGGTSQARRILDRFLEERFSTYDKHRNQPQTDDVSHMSKYLHFGQISPVWLALRIQDTPSHRGVRNRESFLEELIVRRELAINFCEFEPDYDHYRCLPDWARDTLERHRDDERPHRYTRTEVEDAQTHDRYWNAAMREMKVSGYMHNYMRMYWGKKILEWCNTPEYAFRTALELNNKYFIDGRDPNSYAGVAWIFGNHDRAWTERDVFGKVRYMAASGLERKCDIDGYVKKVERMQP